MRFVIDQWARKSYNHNEVLRLVEMLRIKRKCTTKMTRTLH